MNLLSLLVGVVGLLLAVIQQIRIGKTKRKDFRRYLDIAKASHMVMGRVEGIRAGLDKIENCPKEVLIAWAKSHEAAVQLVRMSLQNVFLQDVQINDEQIEHWKATGLLGGYMLETFNMMRLDPPKKHGELIKPVIESEPATKRPTAQ